MAEPDAGTQLTLLGGTEALTPDRLSALYAYPDTVSPDTADADRHVAPRCWVRSNFIATLDGGAAADGKTGELGSPGDRALFQLMRELADVILVGAGTVRIENYGGAKLDARARAAREVRGQAEVPPIGIVTRTGDLDRDMLVFTRTEVTPLVFTCATAAEATRRQLGAAAEVIECSGTDAGAVDITKVLAALAGRGLRRVLTEGGPRLHGTIIDAGLLDELCLTVAPLVIGGNAPRISTGLGEDLTAMRRAHLLADDAGYLYGRYVRLDR